MPRLDLFLAQKGLAPSRSLAAKLIEGGFVFVNGEKAEKCALPVTEKDRVEILENPLERYVSRGGLKLEKALSEFGVDPKTTASLMDTCSCIMQGIIPYGAQLLIASSLSGISSLDIMPCLYYPYLLAACVLISILREKE